MANHSSIALLMTGDELIHGDIIDTNYCYLAETLLEKGLEVQEKCTVGDRLDRLVHQIRRLSNENDLLLINGGLGPTQDDLTAQAMAEAFDLPLKEHAQARDHVANWCERRGYEFAASSLKQAILPEGANIYACSPGSAPAFYIHANDCLVVATPGVPSELKHIIKHELLDAIVSHCDGKPQQAFTKLTLFGIGESRLQSTIDAAPEIKDNLDIGFRAGLPTLELKYRPRFDIDATAGEHAISQLLATIDDNLIGTGQTTPAAALLETLSTHKKMFCSAESCTGGLIASEITQLAGASECFAGSIVSYSNDVKHRVLGVKTETLEEHGAVSEPVALQMLAGVLEKTGSDIGVAVTGIAGPSGGTEDKPVGTVWIAWGTTEKSQAICLCVKFPRVQFQQLVAAVSFELVRREIIGKQNPPAYLKRWQ